MFDFKTLWSLVCREEGVHIAAGSGKREEIRMCDDGKSYIKSGKHKHDSFFSPEVIVVLEMTAVP